jgi:hypothetical protein
LQNNKASKLMPQTVKSLLSGNNILESKWTSILKRC